MLWAKPFDRRGRLKAEANTPIWWTRGAMKRVLLPWDHIVVIAYPSFVEDVSLFLTVVVVVCLRQVPCPRAEGSVYNSVGRRARARNTIQALLCLERSKAPILSFPSSTFPIGAHVWSLKPRLTRTSCPTLYLSS